MKFVIIGDLHGHIPTIHYKDFDAIIAPGDFCSDEPKMYMFQALREHLNNPHSTKRWWDLVGIKKAKHMIHHSLARGRKVLEYLNSFEVPVYGVPGNWDWTPHDPDNFLKKDYYPSIYQDLKNYHDSYLKVLPAGPYSIIGYGISSGPEYPQHPEELKHLTLQKLARKKKEYTKLSSKVSALFTKTKKPVLFISHNVPFNTPLDKINNPASPRNGMHFGSVIARDMIEKHQPLVCIGGHMHEHFSKCAIGRTTVINAGFGPHVNVLLELQGRKLTHLEFHDPKHQYA